MRHAPVHSNTRSTNFLLCVKLAPGCAAFHAKGGGYINIRHIIESVKSMRDIPLSLAQICACLSELDETIYEDIILKHEGATRFMQQTAQGNYTHRAFPYREDTRELIAPERFRKMYVYYVCLEMDLALDEMQRYADDMVLFENAYESFAAYYNENHMPLHNGFLHTAPPYIRSDYHAASIW